MSRLISSVLSSCQRAVVAAALAFLLIPAFTGGAKAESFAQVNAAWPIYAHSELDHKPQIILAQSRGGSGNRFQGSPNTNRGQNWGNSGGRFGGSGNNYRHQQFQSQHRQRFDQLNARRQQLLLNRQQGLQRQQEIVQRRQAFQAERQRQMQLRDQRIQERVERLRQQAARAPVATGNANRVLATARDSSARRGLNPTLSNRLTTVSAIALVGGVANANQSAPFSTGSRSNHSPRIEKINELISLTQSVKTKLTTTVRVVDARFRQSIMLKDNVGYNISPNSFDQFSHIGPNGTFITDRKAIVSLIGDVPKKTGRISISRTQAAKIEQAMGLKDGSLAGGFKVRRVEQLSEWQPRSPLEGNKKFVAGGMHLPGGTPELVVNSIPTKDEKSVNTILEVDVK